MIENDAQLQQTRVALNHLESALFALKRDVLPLNPARFALMAEPVVDHIRKLRGLHRGIRRRSQRSTRDRSAPPDCR